MSRPEGRHRHAGVSPWVPLSAHDYNDHASFWTYTHGRNWDDVTTLALQSALDGQDGFPRLKICEVDLRIQPLNSAGHYQQWSDLHIPQWVRSTTLLARLAAATTQLETVHIKMAAQADQFRLLEGLLHNNPRVRDVELDIDSALLPATSILPTLHLEACFDITRTHAMLKRFIIRAPGVALSASDSTALVARVSEVEELRIVAGSIDTPTVLWKWANRLMRGAPRANAFQLAVAHQDRSPQSTEPALRLASMPVLTDMTLDFDVVDARLLNLVDAPKLKKLRIRTSSQEGGVVPLNHFPRLSYVKVSGSSSVQTRIKMLGLHRPSYHVYPEPQGESVPHLGEMIATIIPGLAFPSPGPTPSQTAEPTISHQHAPTATSEACRSRAHETELPARIGADGSTLVRIPDGTTDEEADSSNPGRRGPRPGYFYKPARGGVVYFGLRPVPSPLGGICPGARQSARSAPTSSNPAPCVPRSQRTKRQRSPDSP